MKKNPILYIKSFGFSLWLIQITILILSKFNILPKLKEKLLILKNKKVINYLSKKYDYVIKKYSKNIKVKSTSSDKIWIFWWQNIESAPEIVKIAINSVKKQLKNKEIVIITKENINEYYKIPKYIQEKLDKGTMTLTTFSDVLRMNLLKKYGGFWMDATIFLTENPFSSIENNKFYTIHFKCEEKTSISKGKWCGFFIGGENPIFYNFMVDFFNEYFKNEKILIDYFLIDYVINIAYNNISKIKKVFDTVPYNNEEIHKLQSLLNNSFNKKEYTKLIKNNTVHKLSYKENIDINFNNYYNYIKNA